MRVLISGILAVVLAASASAQPTTKEQDLEQLQNLIASLQGKLDQLVKARDAKAAKAAYTTLAARAVADNQPLIVFVNCPAVSGPWLTYEVDAVEWGKATGETGKPGLVSAVVSVPHKGELRWLSMAPARPAEEIQQRISELRQALAAEVRGQAATFFTPAGRSAEQPAERDGSPWLPVGEQARIRKLWPVGVPFPDGLKFYDQKPAFQYLQGLNSVAVREIKLYGRGSGEGSDPWQTSGGLHAVSSSEWYNRRGFVLPGAIRVWEEYIFIGAPESFRTNRVRYSFPKGTLAYDVLIKRGDPDHIFAVRVHEKQSDQMYDWDDGTVYAPKVDVSQATKAAYEWAFPRFGIKARSTVWTVDRIDSKVEFVATRNVVEDGGHFTPRGFVGAGARCNECHQQTGRIEYHGTHRDGDYSKLGRGDDGRFFHIFDANGKIDYRWPLVSDR